MKKTNELLNQQIDSLQKKIRDITCKNMTSLDVSEVCDLSAKLSKLLALQLENKKVG